MSRALSSFRICVWALLVGLGHLACAKAAPVPEAAPDVGVAPAPVKTATTAAIPPPPVSPQRYLDVRITSSLEAALTEATDPKTGPQLAQVTKRVLVWWLDVSRDLRKNDRVELVYEPRDDQEPIVHAVWLGSEKLGKPRSAIRAQVEGDTFARYYEEDGSEVELRLKDSPIEGYEQVTSLLRDGRGHKGVDFKAPVGLPIKAPFDGVVEKRNWSFRRNGNCVALVSHRGETAYFLHLSSVEGSIQPGARIKRGQVIARSGNTGHSTAPHLHYQLERDGRVLDPFDVQPTWKKRLSKTATTQVLDQLAVWAKLRAGST